MEFYDFPYIGNIFQRGRYTTNQKYIVKIYFRSNLDTFIVFFYIYYSLSIDSFEYELDLFSNFLNI